MIPSTLLHLAAIALVAMTLVLVGQPIYANDTWIHLALGRAFVESGPWLSADPHLFAAPGAPAPSSWLGAVGIFVTQDVFGFLGLRIAHVLVVSGILGLAWYGLRRASGSALWASLGLIGFILLSTYRLVQLRPHLFSIGTMLLLYLLLIAPRRPPNAPAIGLAAVVCALWANVHAAFLLGPVLILGTSISLFAVSLLPGSDPEYDERARARRLGIAGGILLAATLLNPQGWAAHLSYFSAGDETIGLGVVIDEWGRTNLFSLPALNLPPTPAAWFVCWLCVIGLGVGAAAFWRDRQIWDSEPELRVDPALLALAVAGLGAALFASRFLWLGFFPLALLASVVANSRSDEGHSQVLLPWAGAALGIALLAAHWFAGDWTITSKAIRAPATQFGANYVEPYRADKFYAHAVWLLADAGLTGRIHNDYTLGGFMSFWLAPSLQMSSSGTMNVARDAMLDQLAIAARTGNDAGDDFLELLDRHEIDLFFGKGLPITPPPSRPIASTVRDLEDEPGWLPIFRNLRSVIYLRRVPRNDANLDRVAEYYAKAGVPFDRIDGFQVERVILAAPDWAIEHGVVPVDLDAMMDSVASSQAEGKATLQTRRLALLYSVLGLYDRALKVDRWILRREPDDAGAAQRVVWCLLQLRRYVKALEAALDFEAGPIGEAIGREWSETVRKTLDAPEAERIRRVVRTPLLQAREQWLVQTGRLPAAARE